MQKRLIFMILMFCSFSVWATPIDRSAHEFMVYKTASCKCCTKWMNYLERNGFKVKHENLKNLVKIKTKYKIVQPYASCHTAIVDGYVVEGHVPIVAIEKMLVEKPDIVGITVPGMPPGSPGMESPNPVSYYVYSFDKTGNFMPFYHMP